MQTLEEVVKAIDFPVEMRENTTTNNAGQTVRGIGKQVWRVDRDKSIANTSDTYGLITHAASLKPALAALDGMDFEMKQFYMDGDGRRVMVKALSKQAWSVGKLPSDARRPFIHSHNAIDEMLAAGEDVVRLSLFLGNSYDRTSALSADFAVERVICSNGLVCAHPAFAGLNVVVKIVHSQNQVKAFDVVAFANSVAKLYGAMDQQIETWKKMKNTEIKRTALETIKTKVIEPVTGHRAVDDVVEKAFNGKGQNGQFTLWALYNGFTEVLTGKMEKSKSPVAAHVLGETKNQRFFNNLNAWANENADQLVTVNA